MKVISMDGNYELIIADDPDHDKVFAEIYRDNKFLALISQEDGPDRLKVELPGPGLDESQIVRQLPLADFIAVLGQAAKKLLGKC
jgi:hypothetical protein